VTDFAERSSIFVGDSIATESVSFIVFFSDAKEIRADIAVSDVHSGRPGSSHRIEDQTSV